MLRIAVCDDMDVFLNEATQAIHAWPDKPQALQLDTFSDADLLVDAHCRQPYDILFLDIMMPLLNGIDAAKEIRQRDKYTKIVFLTASAEYGVASYSVKANNYLLKPIDRSALYRCLNELVHEMDAATRCVHIKSASAVHRILLRDIEFVEAQNKQVLFHLTDGATLLGNDPLYSYEHQLTLNDGFYKCHRSYIINLHQIDAFSGKEVTLRSKWIVPIARSSYKEFENAYFHTLFDTGEDAR